MRPDGSEPPKERGHSVAVGYASVVTGVSIAFSTDGSGWRFFAWERFDRQRIEIEIAGGDREVRFDTLDDGVMFFRVKYGWLFR